MCSLNRNFVAENKKKMNQENLQLRRLGENDKVVTFDCGEEDLTNGKLFKRYTDDLSEWALTILK